MEYRRLGKSGMKVSSLSLGTMTFGDGADREMSKQIYHQARESGINFFDTANIYAEGESEKILGRLIKEHRSEVVVASKGYFPVGKGVNEAGSSRFHLTKALDASLKRLGTDYLDLYYLHRFDPETPLEESLETLNDFVRQGKVLYLGVSNFAAWQVMKAMKISSERNFTNISCVQPMYNLLKRQCETEILPMAQDQGLGIVSYSPLAGGFLTGKYQVQAPVEGRFLQGKMGKVYKKRYQDSNFSGIAGEFTALAKAEGVHPVSLAIAWVRSHPGVTAPLIGARNTEQLKPALDSLKISMTTELRGKISSLSPEPALATDGSDEAS